MESKELIAVVLLLMGIPISIGICTMSFQARTAAFFLMIVGTLVTDKADVNFLSAAWYRGTTRGIEVSLVDLLAIGVLVGALLRPRLGERRWYWPAGLGFLLLYFLGAAASVAWSEPRIFGVFELSKIMRGILFFLAAASFVRSEREVRVLVLGLICGLCFESALAVKQRVLDGLYRVTGSIEHANSLSMYLCAVAPVVLSAMAAPLPRFWRALAFAAVAGATLSIVLTVSRAGMPSYALVMAGTAAFCFSWRPTFQKLAVVALVLVGLAGILAKSWDTLMARYGEATFEAEYLDERTEGRGYYLRLARMIIADNVLGVGLNNWSYWVSKSYGARLGTPYSDYDRLGPNPNPDDVPSEEYAAPAHNLAALTVGEMGLPGLFLLGLLWMRWFQMGARFLWRRGTDLASLVGIGIFFGTCGVFMQSVTEWTFRQTHILFTVQIMVGTLAALCWMKKRERQNVVRARAQARAQQEMMTYEPAGA
jgi:O-antigen ligase